MKVATTAASAILLAISASSTSAFTIAPAQPSSRRGMTVIRSTASSTETSSGSSDFASSMPSKPSVYEELGFAEEEIAIGIDPAEVLRWLGTREDLINKIESDNPKFDRERAEVEVMKFMLDGQMVDSYINYEKKKANPANLREEAEQTLSDPKTLATYAAWLGGGAGFATLKNLYVEPKYASGEWTDVHVTIPGSDVVHNLFHHGADQAIVAADAAQHVVAPDAVQSTLEGVAAAVNNAVTCVGDSCP